MRGADVHLNWDLCPDSSCTLILNPREKDKDPVPIFYEMNNCELECPRLKDHIMSAGYIGVPVTYESMTCGQIASYAGTNKHCKPWPNQKKMEFIRVNTNVTGNDQCGQANITFFTDSDPCITNELEDKRGHTGSYGRQILYKTLAQAVISPTVGAIMDYITEQQGQPNYVAAFIIADILIGLSFFCALKIDMDLELPKTTDSVGGLKSILTNVEILLFLLMMFVCGSMYGFVETFLFVFLKEDLHAPMYLLGLTITTGAVVSLPFLYYSDAVVKKVGCEVVIAVALLMYAVRYVGYSYINCAWYAFPFEALEVFTFFSLQVGAAKFIAEKAPPGLLATLTGLEGGAHNGLGKGFGGLLGGFTIEYTKSTHMAFWLFGIVSAFFGAIYSVFVAVFLITKRKKNARKQTWGKGDGQDSDTARQGGVGIEKAKELESFLESAPEDSLRRDSPIGSSAT